MTVVPDNNKIRVLINGISQGSKVLISAGGHIPPIESGGNKLALKKAQNHAKKKITHNVGRKTKTRLSFS